MGRILKNFKRWSKQSEGTISYKSYLERQEVMDLLASSHYLVLPSGLEAAGGMRENFGNVVAEAMAAGRPVLVARGLAWDHLQAYGAGFVFDRDEASVCEVLRKIQNLDRFEWEKLSSNGREYVEQQLNPIKLGERIWQALINSDKEKLSNRLAEDSAYD